MVSVGNMSAADCCRMVSGELGLHVEHFCEKAFEPNLGVRKGGLELT